MSAYVPERKTVGELLSMTNPSIRVPDWQRNYSWGIKEIETFWKDLLHFQQLYPGDAVSTQEYFIGSVVLVDDKKSHLLLDGQQRIATSAILVSVACEFLGKFNADSRTRTRQSYLTGTDDFDQSAKDKV